MKSGHLPADYHKLSKEDKEKLFKEARVKVLWKSSSLSSQTTQQ